MNNIPEDIKAYFQRLLRRIDQLGKDSQEQFRAIALKFNIQPDAPPEKSPQQEIDDYFEDLSLEHELHTLGNDLYKNQYFDEAIVCYNIALQIRSDLLETYFNRGLAYTRKADYLAALSDLNKVIELNPNLAEAHYTRGLIWEYMLDYDKALENYSKALELDPSYNKAVDQADIARQKKKNQEEEKKYGSKKDLDDFERAKRADKLQDALKSLNTTPSEILEKSWRQSEARLKAIESLSEYGRILTTSCIKRSELFGIDGSIQSIIRTLCKMNRKSIMFVGHAGTGKTAVIQELAYRIVHQDPSIPPQLRDYDIFEISTVYLQADTKYVGTYEGKIRDILKILEKCPKILLFVDEIHSFFRPSTDSDYDIFTRGNQAFKGALSEGTITFIGCTTPVEYRCFIEPDQALARRFTFLKLDPPSREQTFSILKSRKKELENYYGQNSPFHISDEIIRFVINATDDSLPSRYQPDKSLQLLDSACSYCITANPPICELNELVVTQALEDTIGHSILKNRKWKNEQELYTLLKKKIVDQNDVLSQLARAVVAGLGEWKEKTEPRGVFLFAGPTGVGKTETALLLAEILGGGRDALIRIDCNTLQGDPHDGTSSVWRLLGVPAGYLGYARGKGGLLSRVRDWPDSFLLFDEFEKASPAVGKLLLQIIDEAKIEDTEGNMLNFRRCFIIFTTNAGSDYDGGKELGFVKNAKADPAKPRLDMKKLKKSFEFVGLGPEFIARITHIFNFSGLSYNSIIKILTDKLNDLKTYAKSKNLQIAWNKNVIPYLASDWQPQYGVRHLSTILRNRVEEHLSIAEALGELSGVTKIRLEINPNVQTQPAGNIIGATTRKKRGKSLIIEL